MHKGDPLVSPTAPFVSRTHIAYFSMEIALKPEMHTYAGGLGVLAGDTVRSCWAPSSRCSTMIRSAGAQ